MRKRSQTAFSWPRGTAPSAFHSACSFWISDAVFTQSDGAGTYVFDALAPGRYRVKFRNETGYEIHKAVTQGGAPGTDWGTTLAHDVVLRSLMVRLDPGDIGEIDAMGRIKITDRKKDLVKTSGGKYIAPSAIESQFKALCPLASNMVVHVEGRNFATALITLDPDALANSTDEEMIPTESDPVGEIIQGIAMSGLKG